MKKAMLASIRKHVPEAFKLKALAVFCAEDVENAHAAVQHRLQLHRQIAQFKTEDGQLAVVIWGRDCDMCESTYKTHIDANIKAYDVLLDRIASNAEGPWSVHMVDDKAYFEPEFRDRALEAFEEGHSWLV